MISAFPVDHPSEPAVTYSLLVYQAITRAIILAVGAGGALFGAGLIVGGPARFTSPSFETARLLPGQQYTWGALMLAAALVTLGGAAAKWQRRVVMAGAAAQGVLWGFFAASIGIVAASDPSTPYTGPIIYTLVAAISGIAFAGGYALRA